MRCLAAALAFTLGCGSRSEPPPARDGGSTSPAAADQGVVLVVGTSLTAGYGLPDPDQAYPGLMQERIDAAGLPYRVVNAGVSGETSAGARRRIEWLFRQEVAVLVLETGANDALRGQDPDATRDNIDAVLSRAAEQEPPPRVVLLGMKAPPNFGSRYTARFDAIYAELASEHGATLVPFLLEGVAGVPALNQADGIHPTPEGQRLMADLVWKAVEPLLSEGGRTPPASMGAGDRP
ncbi:MAG TPA: arylesterase [Vicinamibacteria bacterium]|nr:arylesterase [Vicinamibacteria bacterium]